MELTSWQSQLRKGAAELVVLAVLEHGARYGLEILDAAAGAGVVSEGALYPLLNRLERDGKLIARWSLDGGAPHPRKYYSLSLEGAALLTAMRRAWGEFSAGVTAIVGETS